MHSDAAPHETPALTVGMRGIAALVLVFAAVVGAFTALGAYFAYDTLLKAERSALQSRFELAAQRVVATAQRAASYGIALPAQTTVGDLLRREVSLDNALQRIDIADPSGRLIFSSREIGPQGAPPSREGVRSVKRPILDDLAQPIAEVQVWFDRRLFDDPVQRLRTAIGPVAWQAALLASALTLIGGTVLGLRLRASVRRLSQGVGPGRGLPFGLGFRGAMSLLATATLGLALAFVGWQAQRIGEADITPQLQEKARSLARASAGLVEVALGVGVPLEQLQGVEAHFAGVRRESPEIASLALVAADGRVLFRQAAGEAAALGDPVSDDVLSGGITVARIEAQVDRHIVGALLRATIVDVAFLAVVSLLIALETIALLVGSSAVRELTAIEERLAAARRRTADASGATVQASVSAVRPPLFLFMLAEELTRPFLPGHARSLAAHGAYADLLGSLPLVVGLAVVALCQVPFASWSTRLGRREGFAAGALLTGAGFALAALTQSLELLVLSRAIGAAGFALVFVSAQGQTVDASGPADRARSLAVFARAVLVAAVCGPPLGGILVDRFGVPAVFMVCAVLCLLAMIAATVSLPRRAEGPRPPWSLGLGELPAAWRSPGLPSLLLGCALPAKLVLAAVTFYLVPLGLQRQGWSGAEIGRVLLVYPLVMVVAVPLFAALADRLRQRRLFVIGGGVVAGASCLLPGAGSGTVMLVLALLLFGIGQAMSMTPQSAMVAESAEARGRQAMAGALGLFRLVERSGSAMGPALGATLIGVAGFAGSVMTVGVIGIIGCLGYALATRRHAIRPPQAP